MEKLLFFVIITSTLFPHLCSGLRCYTDIKATKSMSVECGLNTGCVKIYIDSEEMMMRRQRKFGVPPGADGYPELPLEYQNNPVMLRGCFVLAVPDRCYTAKSGLSYCWCSTKDLCNGGGSPLKGRNFLPPPLIGLVLLVFLTVFLDIS
nr:uncharacterized protein LOC121114335 [Lepeophtheirus salmonis]XP_040564206.1 uncharacterized protein LOC121114335 [Lepeophtheirus salmonis]